MVNLPAQGTQNWYPWAQSIHTAVDRQYVNVLEYGANGNGVADNTSAIQNAINEVSGNGGGYVQFPPGRFKHGAINQLSNVVLLGAGHSTTLVQLGTPANLISAAGTLGAVVLLTANAPYAASTITIASTSGIVAGDTLLLTDNASYAATDPTYKSGEQVVVKTVTSGTVLTLTHPIRGSFSGNGTYTTANAAAIKKINFATGVGLVNLSIEGDPASNTTLYRAGYCEAPIVSNVLIREGGQQGLRFHTSRNVTVSNCVIRDLTDNIATGQVGYAIAVSGATDGVSVNNVNVERVRHGFTTMGGADGGPCRIAVTGSTFLSNTTSALDTHAAGDEILFADNVIIGGGAGISIRSRNTTVRDNRIRLCSSHGINVTEDSSGDVSIVGNIIKDVLGGGHGISISTPVSGVVISDNHLSQLSGDGIRVDVGSTDVEVYNNSVYNVGMTLAGRTGIAPIGVSPASGWIVQRNTVGNDAGVGSISTAISGGAGLTGSWFIDNRAFGTFSGSVFNLGANVSRRNERIDQSTAAVTGSKNSNAALTSLISALASQGIITDSTTA